MIEIIVANSPVAGSSELVAELWYDGEELAMLHEDGRLSIWPRNDQEPWSVDLRDLLAALADARAGLLGSANS